MTKEPTQANLILKTLEALSESQAREEKTAEATRGEITFVRTQLTDVTKKVDSIENGMALVRRDLMGEAGEPRMRERVIKLENRVEGHDRDIEGLRNESKEKASHVWQLWLVVIGVMMLPILYGLHLFFGRKD